MASYLSTVCSAPARPDKAKNIRWKFELSWKRSCSSPRKAEPRRLDGSGVAPLSRRRDYFFARWHDGHLRFSLPRRRRGPVCSLSWLNPKPSVEGPAPSTPMSGIPFAPGLRLEVPPDVGLFALPARSFGPFLLETSWRLGLGNSRLGLNTPEAAPRAAARESMSNPARTSRLNGRYACARCAWRCRGPGPAPCRVPWW